MVRPQQPAPISRLLLVLILATGLLPGCGIVPRSRMDESKKLSQLLRTENARLKDQVLALQSQNRDLSDRAVDDLQRLTARERAIEGLERSVQAYQEDRERLAAAYEQLTASLGRRPEATQTGQDRGPARTASTRDGTETSEPWHALPNTISRRDDDDPNR